MHDGVSIMPMGNKDALSVTPAYLRPTGGRLVGSNRQTLTPPKTRHMHAPGYPSEYPP